MIARVIVTQTDVLSWIAHAALAVLWFGLFWSVVAYLTRRWPTTVETALCAIPPIAWYWSRESTQYERYLRYRAGYVERLLPWNWFPDQLGDLFAPMGVLLVLVVCYAIARRR